MLLLAGVGGEVLSYVAVNPALPVYDDVLAGVDATLHFHWPDWLAFQHARPWYGRVMKLAYDSWVVQLYGSALYFALSGQQWRNRELLRIAIASSAFTLAIFYNFPALGPLVHFSVAPKLESFLHVVNLRAGIPLTLGPLDLQGLVSFPSFHTVMAMTFIYVHRGQGWLTWVVVALNLTMLLATIVCGAHYLVDLLGGALVALVAIALVRMSMYTSEKRLIKPQPASPV
jgi:membrane-associated phospholipid phosphatase